MHQLISDWVQNLGNIIIWWEESFGVFWVKSNGYNNTIYQPLLFITNFVRTWIVQFQGPIDIGLSRKLGEQHNIVVGVIWLVLSEIQSLELYNTPNTPFQNTVRVNLNWPISWTSRDRIESKTWGTSKYGGRSHVVAFEWNPIGTTMQYTNHSISERTLCKPELSNFVDQSISDWVQDLGNIIKLWDESFGGFWVKSNL